MTESAFDEHARGDVVRRLSIALERHHLPQTPEVEAARERLREALSRLPEIDPASDGYYRARLRLVHAFERSIRQAERARYLGELEITAASSSPASSAPVRRRRP